MHTGKFRAAAVALALLMCGCSEIDYSSAHTEASRTEADIQQENSVPQAEIYKEAAITEYQIEQSACSITKQLEEYADGDPLTAVEGYSGDGYCEVAAYASIKLTVTAPTSQFYSFALKACGDGGTVSLTVGEGKEILSENGSYKRIDGELHGYFHITQTDIFDEYTLSPVYLEKGDNVIILQVVQGCVNLDRLTVKNTTAVEASRYTDAKTWLSSSDVNDSSLALMNYLSDIYGKSTLTAQYCTPNTNAEIEAIYRNTGRYPAIRFSDLMYYSKGGQTVNENTNTDIQLAVEWGKSGGIVGYSWYWYSTMGKPTFYMEECEFKPSEITSNRTDIAEMSVEELDILLENEAITEECHSILMDMDRIAAELKTLHENNIAVLFRPLPTSGAGWYWWESDPEIYKWLWQTMHRRFDKYHGLSNLIWIHSGTDALLFPGDDFVDIIGCDIYNYSDVSLACAMYETDNLTLNPRMLALTECAKFPAPDLLFRDNAIWLWTAPWSGTYLINENGDLHGDYISVSELKKAYNHELTITKDELEIEDI